MRFDVYLILFLFSLLAPSVLGVKHELFKTCDQSGFCKRNRHFANSILDHTRYATRYAVDPVSIEVNDNGIHAIITKSLPNDLESIAFPIDISILYGNSVHVKIDEDRTHAKAKYVNTKRYDEAGKWAFVKDIEQLRIKNNDNIQIGENKAIIKFEDDNTRVEFNYSPFKITILIDDVVQCVINDKNFLNIEHFRTEESNDKNLHPEELDFNMFSDTFPDARDDSIPLGPESIAVDINFTGFKHIYGIPEHADTLDLQETTHTPYPYRLYNVDIFEYETDSRLPMYGSIPFMMALKPEVSLGIFWINSADTFVDVSRKGDDATTHWMSEAGVMEFVILFGSTPVEINSKYSLLTGPVQLPQLASLGYHQCRWNYNDEKDVLNIHELMDIHEIPYDYIWLDIEYAESKKYFTWNKENFPDPQSMLSTLDYTGRNLVIIIDPHLKTDYYISDEVKRQSLTINSPSNKTYFGHCWPGESLWIDSLNPSSFEFWSKKLELSSSNDFMGKETSTNLQIWNDMNEPSVFDGPETTSPKDNLHFGNWEHRSIHNLYGLTLHELTYKSMVKRYETTTNQRPFVLTRSYFAGSQRTAAMWSGDNLSTWEYLKISIPMCLTSGVVGMPFAGADVGGFFGNPSKELLTRWYQTGIWYPFFRAHAHMDSRRREPWVPGEPFTSHIREAIQLRYSLLPMIYTSFFESTKSGVPVMKPIFYQESASKFIDNYEIEDQFFVGNTGILVKPVTEENAQEIMVKIPDDSIYYSFNNGKPNGERIHNSRGYISQKVDLNTIPMYLQGGNIIATKERNRRSAKLMQYDPFTLIVALDEKNDARGKLYIDDGESFDYEIGNFLDIEFAMTKGKFLTSKMVNAGTIPISGVRIENIIILSQNNVVENSTVQVTQNGSEWSVKCSRRGKFTVLENPKILVSQEWSIDFTTS